MTTNVPAITWTSTGIVVPTAAAVLAGVQLDINAAFGGNLNFTSSGTPQSQLATSLAAVVNNCYAAIAYFVNNVNPNIASGSMQDAIGQIYFLDRIAGAPTVVQCTCVGLPNTVIPAGSQAQDTSGNRYVSTQAATIPIAGSVVIPFQNIVNGPIACPANTLTQIYQSIPGWDTINNSSAGVVGNDVETQAAFELRRSQSVAINSQGALQSIYGSVLALPGVIDAYAYENDQGSPIFVGSTNYELLPNSIYIGVAGGEASAIANAIWAKKSPGCNMNGNTSVIVYDTTNYQQDFPKYTIKLNTLTDTPIYFAIQLQNNANLPSNILALVQAAVIAQFTGANGAPRARAGALLLAAQYYGPIIAISPGTVTLLSVLVGLSSGSANAIQMGIDQEPTISAGNISVQLV